MLVFDEVFAHLAVLLLLWARFSGLRELRALQRSIAALRIASRAWQAKGGDLKALAAIAMELHRIERGANEVLREGRRRLAVRLRGRSGRLDLLDNFFLRNQRIEAEIDLWLLDMDAACSRAIRDHMRSYRSPLNPLNGPSSLVRFLGVSPPWRRDYLFDLPCWGILATIAWALVAGVGGS